MAFIETTITPEMIEKYDMAQDYLEIANHKRQDFLTYGQEEPFGKSAMAYRRLGANDNSKKEAKDLRYCFHATIPNLCHVPKHAYK